MVGVTVGHFVEVKDSLIKPRQLANTFMLKFQKGLCSDRVQNVITRMILQKNILCQILAIT
jgi:hypothetical protein